jgi:hypothetical protein
MTIVECIIAMAAVVGMFVTGILLGATLVGSYQDCHDCRYKNLAKSQQKTIKSPVQAYKEHKLTKEQEKEIEKYTTIMENVENYDGTGANQKDVPL